MLNNILFLDVEYSRSKWILWSYFINIHLVNFADEVGTSASTAGCEKFLLSLCARLSFISHHKPPWHSSLRWNIFLPGITALDGKSIVLFSKKLVEISKTGGLRIPWNPGKVPYFSRSCTVIESALLLTLETEGVAKCDFSKANALTVQMNISTHF